MSRTNPGEFAFTFYLESREMCLEVACVLEFEPASGDGWHEPRCEASVSLISAKLGEIDITPALSDDDIAAIEQDAFEERAAEMQEQIAEAAFERRYG